MEHLETAAGATAPPPQTATDIQLSGKGITRESAAVDCDGDGGGGDE